MIRQKYGLKSLPLIMMTIQSFMFGMEIVVQVLTPKTQHTVVKMFGLMVFKEFGTYKVTTTTQLLMGITFLLEQHLLLHHQEK